VYICAVLIKTTARKFMNKMTQLKPVPLQDALDAFCIYDETDYVKAFEVVFENEVDVSTYILADKSQKFFTIMEAETVYGTLEECVNFLIKAVNTEA
jgi:hypothetical protein